MTSMPPARDALRRLRADQRADDGHARRPVRVVAAARGDTWNEFVASAGGSFLQSWQWGEFKRGQGWRVLRLMAWRGREPAAALQVLIKVIPWVGAFCYGAEGPVLQSEAWSGDSSALTTLLAEVRRRVAPCGGIVLTVDPLTSDAAVTQTLSTLGLRPSLNAVQPEATAVVHLNRAEEDLWRGLARDARYRIGRAQRDGVVVRPGNRADVPGFAAMIAETGRRKGFGVRDGTYLAQLVAMLEAEDCGAFMVAELHGALAGATVVSTFGQRALSLYTASDEMGRRVGVQHLLHWEAMLRARRSNCALYDFRGIGADGAREGLGGGLSFFKQRFGTEQQELVGAWDDVYRRHAYQVFLRSLDARRRGVRTLSRLLSRTGRRSGH
jgi:lipid II:glycine glycyltransferase (peptidoglycan interpeptide bridge formation enzyme)